MNNVKAFGTFQMKNGLLFRKSAYLQWGNSQQSLGSFLLLNPGNAKPDDGLLEDESKEEEVKLDPTMKQMVKLVENIYSKNELNGCATIYNLFTLRNPQKVDAIKNFERLAGAEKIDPFEGVPNIEELRTHPWICCGWGINDRKRYKQLQRIKSFWKTLINDSDIPNFGKPHQNGVDYYHINPLRYDKRAELLEELHEIYNRNVKSIV